MKMFHGNNIPRFYMFIVFTTTTTYTMLVVRVKPAKMNLSAIYLCIQRRSLPFYGWQLTEAPLYVMVRNNCYRAHKCQNKMASQTLQCEIWVRRQICCLYEKYFFPHKIHWKGPPSRVYHNVYGFQLISVVYEFYRKTVSCKLFVHRTKICST